MNKTTRTGGATPAVSAEAATSSLKQVKALSNPDRLSILRILRWRESARATDLGEESGLAANRLSYHLKVLSQAGLVAEDLAKTSDKRERWWKLSVNEGFFIDTEADPSMTKAAEELEKLDRTQLASLAVEGGARATSEHLPYLRDSIPVLLTKESAAVIREELDAVTELVRRRSTADAERAHDRAFCVYYLDLTWFPIHGIEQIVNAPQFGTR